MAAQLPVKVIFDVYIMLAADLNQTIEYAKVTFVENVRS